MKTKLLLIFFVAFMFYISKNFWLSDIISPIDNFTSRKYDFKCEIIKSIPEWYFLVLEFINKRKHIDWTERLIWSDYEKVSLWKCINRIWWYENWGWTYTLYLVPDDENDIKNPKDSRFIVPKYQLSTIKSIPEFMWKPHYLFDHTPHYYAIKKEWDTIDLIYKGNEHDRAKKINRIENFYFFLSSLILTILVKTSCLWILTKTSSKVSTSTKRVLLTWLVASWITLPIIWYILPIFITNELWHIIGWWLIVLLIETIIIRYILKTSWWKTVLFCFICNFSLLFLWFVIINKDAYIPLSVRRTRITEGNLRISGFIWSMWLILLLINIIKNFRENK